MVLVDTSVWSLALRRRFPVKEPELEILIRLIEEDRAGIIGAIRQELLTGISDTNLFKRLARSLEAYVDILLDERDYVRAAEFCNTCRKRGVQGSNTDFLICAAADRYEMTIFTLDRDFERFVSLLPVRLFDPQKD